MKISEHRQGAVSVLKPVGPVTQAEAAELKNHIARALSANVGRVVLDMSEIPFVDSAALEALLDITEELSNSGQTLKICAPNKTIREVLTLTELAGMFDQFEDMTTAVRSFL